MKIKNSVLRLLIKELLSPVGDSEAELMSDMSEVVEVLDFVVQITLCYNQICLKDFDYLLFYHALV